MAIEKLNCKYHARDILPSSMFCSGDSHPTSVIQHQMSTITWRHPTAIWQHPTLTTSHIWRHPPSDVKSSTIWHLDHRTSSDIHHLTKSVIYNLMTSWSDQIWPLHLLSDDFHHLSSFTIWCHQSPDDIHHLTSSATWWHPTSGLKLWHDLKLCGWKTWKQSRYCSQNFEVDCQSFDPVCNMATYLT